MANYAASVLAEAKLILAERYAAPEKRIKSPDVFGIFRKNTELAIPNVGKLRTSHSRAEKGYFSNRSKRSNTSSRTHNHSGSTGDSTEVTFSWATYGDKFKTSLKRGENNVFSDALIMANELDNAFKNSYEAMDAAALAYLASNKTEVNAAVKNGVFDTTHNSFEIATANMARFIQYGKSMLQQNHYKGAFDSVLDPVLFLEAQHYLNQGAGNSTNTAYQASLGADIWQAVGLTDSSYPKGTGYFIPTGTVGVVDWIPQKNHEGWGDFESYNGGYGKIVNPINGLEMAVHGYSERANNASTGGDGQDVNTEWEITVDLSFNNSPLTHANETTIFEVGIVDAPANA